MKKQSAGLLLFKRTKKGVEVLIGHPGGPFWAKRSQGSWSIPKGEITTDEDMFTAAKREFAEELGAPAPEGDYISLGDAKQPSGKVVYIWAYEADFDASHIASNLFEMEWPPKSGQTQQFPELDKAGWFTLPKHKQSSSKASSHSSTGSRLIYRLRFRAQRTHPRKSRQAFSEVLYLRHMTIPFAMVSMQMMPQRG